MEKQDESMQRIMAALNKGMASVLGNVHYKGTSTYYYAGHVGNKSVCYTVRKTGYQGRWGFWSWIQTEYKTGKIKRTRFAKSGSGQKAKDRAYRLLKQLEK